MEYVQQVANIANVQNYATSLRETRLGSLKHPGEFFDWQRVGRGRQSMLSADEQVSRPKDTSEYMKRASYNMCVISLCC
jgi:hypothetical protein